MHNSIEIIVSEDGSNTLFLPDLQEHYHSTHGAVNEAMVVYIQNALLHHLKQKLNILEIGFGTGLNALMTLLNQQNREIHYTSIEKFPLDETVYLQLNYPQLLNCDQKQFLKFHQAQWEEDVEVAPNFIINKKNVDLTNWQPTENYDIVYFDAFAPDKQPELWQFEIFEKIYQHLNDDAILTTYCAKGQVRRDLQKAGFVVERLPGPIGKREILRATKSHLNAF